MRAIDAAGVTKLYAPHTGVSDLDLSVEAGSILGLIGPSGSGKTTTVRLLTGLLSPDAGELSVLGESPDRFTPETRRRIGYLPQEAALYPTLTIAENVEFAASMQGMGRWRRRARTRELLELVGLHDVSDRRVEDASGGMRRRAGLAAALVHQPDLVFLDEPTAGVDPILRQSLWDELHTMRDRGRTIVVTTQYVGETSLCDEIVLLAHADVAAKGRPEDLRRRAYGGEILDVRFEEAPDRSSIDRIAGVLGAVSAVGTGLREVRFIVPDAGTASARLQPAAEAEQLAIAEIDRHVPGFDDVFVRIVDGHRRRNGVRA